MKHAGYILILILAAWALAACAPVEVVYVKTTRGPEAFKKKIDMVVKVEKLDVGPEIPREFESHALYEPLKYSGNLAEDLTRSFAGYLGGTGLFKEVVTEYDSPKEAGIVIRGRVNRFHWEETGSLWTSTALAVLTLNLYPVLGGPINWPAGEAEIVVEVFKTGSGKRICGKLRGEAVAEEALSIYQNEKDTPEAQLMEAYTRACEQLAEKLNGEANNIVFRYENDIEAPDDPEPEPEETETPDEPENKIEGVGPDMETPKPEAEEPKAEDAPEKKEEAPKAEEPEKEETPGEGKPVPEKTDPEPEKKPEPEAPGDKPEDKPETE